MDFEYDPKTGVEVPGLRGKDVDLLHRAGIVYLHELAEADLFDLQNSLLRTGQQSHDDQALPDEEKIASWIEQARRTARSLAPLIAAELPGDPTEGVKIRRPANGADDDGDENGDEE